MPWKQTPLKSTKPAAKATSRRLRHTLTDSEKVLWKHLRGDFAGSATHFRRQVAIGSYVADFCCLGHRLIVEVDGAVHEGTSQRRHDTARDQALRAGGYRVLRFANREVALELNLVLDRIASAECAA